MFSTACCAPTILKRYPEKRFLCDRTDRPIGPVCGPTHHRPASCSIEVDTKQRFYPTAVSEHRNPFVSANAETWLEKDLLVSFVGRNSPSVRGQLFAHDFGSFGRNRQ